MDIETAPPQDENRVSAPDHSTALISQASPIAQETPAAHSSCRPQSTRHFDFFAVLALIFVALFLAGFVVVMPPFQFNDEHAHFARAYQISRGQIFGLNLSVPPEIMATMLRYPENVMPKTVPRTHVSELFGNQKPASTLTGEKQTQAGLHWFKWGLSATQLYSPTVYFPAAAGICVARTSGMSPLGMMYMARLASALTFFIAVVAAFLLAPNFRALFLALALMPMTLQQAVAITADTVTISLSFVVFAFVLHTRQNWVSRKQLGVLLGLVVLLVLSKSTLWAPLVLLLVPADRFVTRKKHLGYLALAAIVSMASIVALRFVTRDAIAGLRIAALARGFDFTANAWRFATHPLKVLSALITAPGHQPLDLLHQFVGAFGWRIVSIPDLWQYFLVIVLIAVFEASPKPFTIRERMVLGSIFACALLFTFFSLYVIDGTVSNGRPAFASVGVQGRYLIPFCLAGFLAIRQSWFTLSSRRLLFVAALASAYYVTSSLGTIAEFFYR